MASAGKQGPRILFVSEGQIATTRIIERLLRSMPETFEPDVIEAWHLSSHHIENNILVFCRVCREDLGWLPPYLARRGIAYGYYTDDNFWELRGDSQVALHYQKPAVIRTLNAFVGKARFVLLNSSFLRNYLEKKFTGIPMADVNSFFDTRLLSRPVTIEKSPRLRVGYAGGAREAEFALLTPALERVLEAHKGKVELEFIGWGPPALLGHDDVKLLPGVENYEAFIDLKRSRGWDIGLSPLLYSVFTSSKTNNKYREFAGCGIASIYSDIPPYRGSVTPGRTGLLAENTSEAWQAALETLIADSGLRASIAREGQADIAANYSLEAVAHAWRDALAPLVAAWRPVRFTLGDRIAFRAEQFFYAFSYLWERLLVNYRALGLIGTARKILRRLMGR